MAADVVAHIQHWNSRWPLGQRNRLECQFVPVRHDLQAKEGNQAFNEQILAFQAVLQVRDLANEEFFVVGHAGGLYF